MLVRFISDFLSSRVHSLQRKSAPDQLEIQRELHVYVSALVFKPDGNIGQGP